MAYLNELVPEADIVALDLKRLRREYLCMDAGFQWTVDRSTGSWLMPMGSNP